MSRYRDYEWVLHLFVTQWEGGIKGVNLKQEEKREREILAGDSVALLC